MNKRQLEALIKGGVFDSFGKTRLQLFAVYEDALNAMQRISKSTQNGQLDIMQFLSAEEVEETIPKIDYPEPIEFDIKDKLLYEREILGMCFSGHILDSYSKHLNELSPSKLTEILNNPDIKDRTSVNVAGLVVQKTVKKTKNDENMAFVKLADSCGEIELVVFPKAYLKYSDQINTDNVIFVTGQISLSDEQEPKIIVNTIENVMQNQFYKKSPINSNSKLYLKVQSIDSNVVTEIISLLKEYTGDTEIVFYDLSKKKYIRANNVKISVNQNIISALKMILGEDAVVLKD